MQIFGNVARFAVYVPPHSFTFPDYLRLWQTAEELGYDGAYLTDHIVASQMDRSGTRSSIFEGFTLLSAMAARTERLRCGINVVGNTFRNPGLVAKMASTIDHVSNGRLELGLGAGHHVIEHQQYNIPFHTTGRRLRMLGEAATMIRSLLTKEETSFEGNYYQLNEAVAEPKPLQPRLPIIIGGVGEDLTLRIVAESADIWNIYLLLPPDVYQHKLDVLGQHCEDLGRDPQDIRKSMIVTAITAKTESEAKAKASGWSGGIEPIVGTPEQVVEELLHYTRLGVRDFLFYLTSPVDFESVELIASEVAPLVRKELAS